MDRVTYTVAEVAEMLGISRSKAYGYVRSGEIPGAIILGHRIIIRKTVFDEWIANPDSSARRLEDKYVLWKREMMECKDI